jgi:NhaP-type Na+/H+ or K+/H+ antiporter
VGAGSGRPDVDGVSAIQLLLVVVGAIAVTALAHRKGLQPSLVVVVLASAVSFVPGLPRFQLPPELILSVVLPPLLYSAALDFSFVTFARNLRPILSLGVGMVVVSTLVTGVVAAWAVPGLALAPALVLGAVVAPPDAVAALAVGRRLGLPKKLMAILTGESLVNDAAALTILALTVAAVTGSHTLFHNPLLLFAYGAVVGIVIGLLLGAIVHWIRLRLRDSGLETALGLLVPFAAYLLAEQVHASGVLAVVAAGFSLGYRDGGASFATRLQGRQVWKSLDVLLESFVFAYMGLQCRFVFADLASFDTTWSRFVLGAVAVLAAVLVIRPVWVFITYGQHIVRARLLRWLAHRPRVAALVERKAVRLRAAERSRRGFRRGSQREARSAVREGLPWRYVVVISWTGMRGVVTLAAAAGIPAVTANGTPFPGRDLIQALAFVVAVGTLLSQGPTLPPLIRRLRIVAPEEQEREAQAVMKAGEVIRQAAEAAMADLPEGADPVVVARLRAQIERAVARSRTEDAAEADASLRDTMVIVRQSILAAQRTALVRARNGGELDDDVVRRELERLDYEEAAFAAMIR